jgi:transposase
LLESRPHPEQGYRSCLGILRLAKQHGPERLDAACARALAAGARSYRHVESILKHGLGQLIGRCASAIADGNMPTVMTRVKQQLHDTLSPRPPVTVTPNEGSHRRTSP